MIESVTTVSQQTSAETQTVSAAAQQQTAAITEVSGSAESLSEQATRLQSLLDRFDVEAASVHSGQFSESQQTVDSEKSLDGTMVDSTTVDSGLRPEIDIDPVRSSADDD